MQIYFIRHAQSVNNAVWDDKNYNEETRMADPVLTKKGREQARLTAEHLAENHPDVEKRWVDPQNRVGYDLTHIYCSLMERAVQTGSVIAERLDLPLEGLVDLHEVGGIYLKEQAGDEEIVHILHGHGRSYFEKHYPRLLLTDGVDGKGWWQGGIEAKEVRFPRARRILEFLLERHGDSEDRVGVIIHGGIYRYIFRMLFNFDPQMPGDLNLPYNIIINNCSISRFDFEEDGFSLMYQNKVDFLPEALVT